MVERHLRNAEIERKLESIDDKLESVDDKLRHLHNLLHEILERNIAMSAEFDRLTQEVAETKGIVESIKTLASELADFIRANVNDPVALTAMADSLDADQATLATAVTTLQDAVAGTPKP